MPAEANPFLIFYELGYKRLVPIVPPSAPLSPNSTLYKRVGTGKDPRGKAVGIKGHDGMWRGLDWLRQPVSTPDMLQAWASMGAGVGIRTGDGLVALDIDSLEQAVVDKAVALAEEMLGSAPKRIGRAPKILLLYRTPHDAPAIPYMRVEFANSAGAKERIELLSTDRQFVAYGTHPGTGKPYQWVDPLDHIDDLAVVTEQELQAYFAALSAALPSAGIVTEKTTTSSDRKLNQHELAGDLTEVTKAVAALPNTTDLFPSYDDYIRVGAAIKGATQEDPDLGLELFLQWAGRWDGGNDLDAAEADYSRIKPPFSIGASYLYKLAEQLNPEAYTRVDQWYEPVSEPATDNLFDAALSTQTPSTPAKPFSLTSAAEAATSMSGKSIYLIKGLLDLGAASVIYGRSNSGKTFIATDISFHIAAGLPWAGMKTRQGPVIYVAAEGGRGVKKRAAALRHKYGSILDNAPLYFLLQGVNLFSSEADLNGLIALANQVREKHGTGPALIVIDTLARAMAGGDENNAKDMGMLVRHMDIIRAETKAHTMFIHHSGKDRSKGARGSNALLGAIDTEIEVADNIVTVTKQRDMDKGFSTGFGLDEVALYEDEDGDLVTSCVVKLLPVAAVKKLEVGDASEDQQAILEAIQHLISTDTNSAARGVTRDAIVQYLGVGPAGARSVGMRLNRLQASGQVVRTPGKRWSLVA